MVNTIALMLMLVAAPQDAAWAALDSLTGEWIGEGTGQPGQGAGGFSFRYDLDKRVFVRRNFAEYPATKDRPAFRHDDLMIVYREAAQGPVRAVYFDNEGHVIHYTVTAEKGPVRFVSEPSPTAPRFRFTYTSTGKDTVDIQFDIAPPGKPEAFAPYITAKARRKPGS